MFRMADLGLVFWPVMLPQFNADGTVEDKQVFIQYQILTRDERRAEQRRQMDAYRTAMQAAESGADAAKITEIEQDAEARDAASMQLLRERVKGWMGIEDDAGPVAFSAERLEALLCWEPYAEPILKGLYAASRGAHAKNSQPGPAGGSAGVQA